MPDGDTRCLDTMEFQVAPECDAHEDCTDPATPYCHPTALTCQACLTDFDFSASAPACNTLDGLSLQCMTVDRCFGDDAREPKDDGAVGATAVTFGQTYAGRLCGSDDTQPLQPIELDWYTFELAEESDVWFDVEVPADFYLDSLYLSFVTGGEAIGSLGPFTSGTTQRGATLPAGRYFVGALWVTTIEDVLLHYELKIYLD